MEPSPALFHLVRDPVNDRLQVRVHPPRAEVSTENDLEEIGQYRTADALRSALEEVSIDGRTAVFEDSDAQKVLTDTDVTADHAWIGQPRYERITFVANEEAASEYVSELSSPSD